MVKTYTDSKEIIDLFVQKQSEKKSIHCYAFIFRENNGKWEVLLVKNNHSGKYGAPGGFRENTDLSNKSTVVREVKEEVGIEIPLSKLEDPMYVFARDITISIYYTYISDEKIECGSICKKELKEAKWCSLEDFEKIKPRMKIQPLLHITPEIVKILGDTSEAITIL